MIFFQDSLINKKNSVHLYSKKKVPHVPKRKQYEAAQHIINQHIRMISEGSCDTEDWSNNDKNSALLHRNKLHFKVYKTGNQY